MMYCTEYMVVLSGRVKMDCIWHLAAYVEGLCLIYVRP